MVLIPPTPPPATGSISTTDGSPVVPAQNVMLLTLETSLLTGIPSAPMLVNFPDMTSATGLGTLVGLITRVEDFTLQILAGDIELSKCVYLEYLNLPALAKLTGSLTIGNGSYPTVPTAPLDAVSFPALVQCGNITLFNLAAITVAFPSLPAAGAIVINGLLGCTTVDFGSLTACTGFTISQGNALTSLNLPVLASCTLAPLLLDLNVLTALDLSALAVVDSGMVVQGNILADVLLCATGISGDTSGGYNVDFGSCPALTMDSLNSILDAYIAGPINGGTMTLGGPTPDGPTAAKVAILTGRGWTVTTN